MRGAMGIRGVLAPRGVAVWLITLVALVGCSASATVSSPGLGGGTPLIGPYTFDSVHVRGNGILVPPVKGLSDPALFFSQLARVSTETDGGKLRDAGNELFNRLKDYKIATVTLLEMSIEDVGPIFERISNFSLT